MCFIDNKLKKQILQELVPSKNEILVLEQLISIFLQKIKCSINKFSYSIKVELGGSYAKNTYLREDFDIDFFFQFQDVVDDKVKERQLLNILNDSNIFYNIERGSRMYVSGIFKIEDLGEFNFECVPTQRFENPILALNSTDVSIHHVRYLQKQIKEDRNLSNEIRLAKAWFKSQNLYGAESYINGFSGHSIECLLMRFRNFEKLIEFFSNMQKGTILQIENTSPIFPNSTKNSNYFSKDKYSPLMIQDPILKERNALSALEDEIFYNSKLKAIFMLKTGCTSNDFLSFKKNNLNTSPDNLEKIKQDFFNSKLPSINVEFVIKSNTIMTTDIIGSKTLKLVKKIVKLVKKKGFETLDFDFLYCKEFDIIFAKILCKNFQISKFYYEKGISLDISLNHINNYLDYHNNEELKLIGNTLYLIKNRDYISLKELTNIYFKKNEEFLDLIYLDEFNFIQKVNTWC
ncbi:MAG: nucleotidyltransferase domain-containing protein [Candidatus Woesearchaeota archaeon]